MQSPHYCVTAMPTPCPSPMAVSSHLGLFHVSVMALPVTEATVGGPSGGVGTTSARERWEVGETPGAPGQHQLPRNLHCPVVPSAVTLL